MASLANMTALKHIAFPNTWISEAFERETEVITKALQKSLSDDQPAPGAIHFTEPRLPPASNPTLKPIPAARKIPKRKSRPSKQSFTTFITADPTNFRQMVQQVTGIGFPASHMLKPEQQRPGDRVQVSLPTLDTSAFPLEHHHPQAVGPTVSEATTTDAVSFAPDFDNFHAFPTLESWQVM